MAMFRSRWMGALHDAICLTVQRFPPDRLWMGFRSDGPTLVAVQSSTANMSGVPFWPRQVAAHLKLYTTAPSLGSHPLLLC